MSRLKDPKYDESVVFSDREGSEGMKQITKDFEDFADKLEVEEFMFLARVKCKVHKGGHPTDCDGYRVEALVAGDVKNLALLLAYAMDKAEGIHHAVEAANTAYHKLAKTNEGEQVHES